MAADRRELKKKGKPRREAAAADTCQPFAIAVSEDCDGTTTSKNSSNAAINSCHHDPFCPPCYLLLHTLQPHPDIKNYFVRFCSSSIAGSASTTTYISSSIFTSYRDEGPILQDLSFANVIICLTMGVFLAAMLRRTDGHKGWVHELVPIRITHHL
jgi:hypothetical protein